MAAPLPTRFQTLLQAAVQSVHWTYSLFWQLCPQQGILVWADGYYNGAIKTRKTVQPMEVSAEEASLQRSQQLRELYESLSAGETNPPARRPCAALSPEDLTESEWFYLMCVSFSFPPGIGLPGKAYARRQHVWLAGANEVDSKTFSRAILAKSARIQTVVCIPLMDGVVELGTTDKVQEDLNFIQHVKSFFIDHQRQHHPPPPKPALSEHSTSNPTTSSDHSRFHSAPIPTAMYSAVDPSPATPAAPNNHMNEDDEEDDEEEADSDSEAETARNSRPTSTPNASGVPAATAAEPSELMQLEMSEDIRVGSPDDGSNNLDSDFHMLAVSHPTDHVPSRVDSYRAESTRRWVDPVLQLPAPEGGQLEDLTQEDTHYSQTVSTILHNQSIRWAESPSVECITYSSQSAFAKWSTRADHHHHHHLHVSADGTSQWLLKYILFTVPFLHAKYQDDNSPTPRDGNDPVTRLRGKGTPQDELSANHVLAERRRREKLNERFIILRSLVPFVTKMDKASILGDTIEYVKQLRKKIQDLEARNRQMEVEQQSKEQPRSLARPGPDKRKMRILEGSGGMRKPKTVEESPPSSPSGVVTSVQVSIIESDALLELECENREGLLLDVMQMLREMRIEVTTVQSSLNNGVFMAELRAKVKENPNGKKTSIVEVKRALNQIIPHND
ncbi:basic helix-loop-helix protein A [Prosopis cineraria]|uniref:basic helix-loop-helix protein A n=1 Tax=Prosopis cineraria TaxID=364024 RepID=UPI00240FAAB8|nr:basic helix-loop-helix protein A [Prosopis cineraria]